jgi:hypothetical protein
MRTGNRKERFLWSIRRHDKLTALNCRIYLLKIGKSELEESVRECIEEEHLATA